MTEDFTLQQVSRDAGGIDGKKLSPPPGIVMDQLRDMAFAGAGFS